MATVAEVKAVLDTLEASPGLESFLDHVLFRINKRKLGASDQKLKATVKDFLEAKVPQADLQKAADDYAASEAAAVAKAVEPV
jgi:hypothetical protein